MASSYLPEAHAASIDPQSLWEFIPAVTPTFSKPTHLAPIVEAIEQAMAAARGEAEPVFVCSSVPPQHAKTETYLHGLAYWLKNQPQDFLAYLSYNGDQAEAKSRKVRDYVRIVDVPLRDDTRSVKVWRTPQGGGLMSGGVIGGSVTGKESLKGLLIDDPYKGRSEAESRAIRDKTWDEFTSSIWTRLHSFTSVFVNHTRWHPDDLIGRLKKDPKLSRRFRFINLPAVTGCDPLHGDDYEVLWPEVMGKDLIRLKREGASEYEWWSLYQGDPRPRDTQVFRGVTFYNERPLSMRVAIGLDFAYSSKSSSDFSVAVVMGENAGRYYVLDVVRRQCPAPEFAKLVKGLQVTWPNAPTMAYVAGPEVGVVDFMQGEGVRVSALPATENKYTRAQGMSAAWNSDPPKILVPQGAHWVEPFTSVLLDFTGLDDPHDDDVDAAVAAFDALKTAVNFKPSHRPNKEPTRERRERRANHR